MEPTEEVSMRGRSLVPGACAVVAALVLGGCDGSGSTDESDDRAPATPTQTSPPPSGPTVPAKAAEASADGAKAYVGYYVEVVNYAADSGDTARLDDAASECAYCQQFAAVYENIYDNGGSFDGKPYELQGVEVTEESSTMRAVARLKSRTGATFQIAENTKRRTTDARTFTWTLELRRDDDGWRIVGMDESY